MKNAINDEIKTFYDKLEQVKIENGKYNYQLINQSKELKEKCDEFPKINESLEKKLEEFRNINDYTIKNMEGLEQDFEVYKVKFSELSEFIKVGYL